MSTYAEHLAVDRRLVILRILREDTDYSLNDRMLQTLLSGFGHNVTLATIRADFEWMKQAQALTYELVGDDVYVATMTRMGLDHVELRAVIPGIKRPSPAGKA